MFEKLLVPTDFSEGATRGLSLAVSIARDRDAEIHLLHVVEPLSKFVVDRFRDLGVEDADDGTRFTEAAEKELAGLRDWMWHEYGISGEIHVRRGYPAKEILDFTEESEPGLLVTSTHSRVGAEEGGVGSVSAHVIRNAPCPVITVGCREGSDEVDFRPRRILFPADADATDATGLSLAAELARHFDAELHILHVLDSDSGYSLHQWEYLRLISPENFARDVEGKAEEFLAGLLAKDSAGCPVVRKLVHGRPHEEILKYAAASAADLIVMPTHVRSEMLLALIGSVAERVVRMADCPVLTVSGAALNSRLGSEADG